ncbi:MAG TPA: hypothetical protein GXZ78_00740 [Eubacteriaceae bacterium]|nr:hypothetical protein [Eubacteriaceae bacterium]
MNQFLYGLASITTTLQPIMIFIALLAFIFFIFYLKNQIDLFMKYQKSIMISLKQISNEKQKMYKDMH